MYALIAASLSPVCVPASFNCLQNNLNEYYTMIHWVMPDLMGSPNEFKEDFTVIIEKGVFMSLILSKTVLYFQVLWVSSI